MAMTSAERQQAFRDRQRAKRREMTDAADPYLRRTFSEFWKEAMADDKDGGEWSMLEQNLLGVGIDPAGFDVEGDPDLEGPALVGLGLEDRGSIGRAERMAAAFIDAYRVMASMLNRFKREEIEARIAELHAADMSDPATRKQALADIVRLQKIHDRLGKEVRYSFPAYEIRG